MLQELNEYGEMKRFEMGDTGGDGEKRADMVVHGGVQRKSAW